MAFSAVEGCVEVSRLGIGGPGAVWDAAVEVASARRCCDERERVTRCGTDVYMGPTISSWTQAVIALGS